MYVSIAVCAGSVKKVTGSNVTETLSQRLQRIVDWEVWGKEIQNGQIFKVLITSPCCYRSQFRG